MKRYKSEKRQIWKGRIGKGQFWNGNGQHYRTWTVNTFNKSDLGPVNKSDLGPVNTFHIRIWGGRAILVYTLLGSVANQWVNLKRIRDNISKRAGQNPRGWKGRAQGRSKMLSRILNAFDVSMFVLIYLFIAGYSSIQWYEYRMDTIAFVGPLWGHPKTLKTTRL